MFRSTILRSTRFCSTFRSKNCLILLFILFFFGMTPVQADTAIHPFLQSLVHEPDQPIPPVLYSFMAGNQGRQKLDGKDALDLHLRTTASRETLESLGIEVRTLHDGRATVTVLPSQLADLAEHREIQSISLPRPLYPNLSDSTPDTGVAPLRSQLGGAFSGATGNGVIVGVIDSGIDIDHPNFMDDSGKTRILFALDQNTNTECTSADIDGGTCPIVDESDSFGHGTHVTGIAAGNGAAPDENGNPYSHVGMAPEANIIFVKTDFLTTGIIDGLNYIFAKADELELPAVVNLSLGSQMGAHDGTDSLEEEIDALVAGQNGRAVVVSAGNSRDDGIHAEIATVNGASVVGPAFKIDPYTASAGAANDLIQLVGYYPQTDNLTVHLWSPNREYVSHALNTNALGSPCAVQNTPDGEIWVCNNYQSQLDQSTSDREIIIFIIDDSASQTPAAGTWQIALSGTNVAGDGIVDFWMASRLGGSSSRGYFSTHVEDSKTLGVPATSREAITVGAYITRTCWDDYTSTSQSYSGSYTLGELAPFSSAGPTRDGRTKPDLAAPGMGIISPIAHEVRSDIINAGFGDLVVNNDYLLLQGTSQSAPHVTGAVALLFEEDPSYTTNDIKSILRSGAREDRLTAVYDQSSTGFISFGTVNYSFGAGKLDLGQWAFNDPYETNDQARNAYDVVSGQTLNGFIERAEDIDLFHLGDVAIGDIVNIQLTNLPDDYALRFQRKWNTFLPSCGATNLQTSAVSDNSGTTNESIAFTTSLFNLPRYIRVTSSAGNFTPSSPYDLRAVITRPETTGNNDSIASPQVLPDEFKEFKVAGSFSTLFDQDFYRFKATGGGTITASAPLRFVRILNQNGQTLNSGTGSASYSPGLVLPGSTSTYYVVVSASGQFPIAGSYTLTLTH